MQIFVCQYAISMEILDATFIECCISKEYFFKKGSFAVEGWKKLIFLVLYFKRIFVEKRFVCWFKKLIFFIIIKNTILKPLSKS